AQYVLRCVHHASDLATDLESVLTERHTNGCTGWRTEDAHQMRVVGHPRVLSAQRLDAGSRHASRRGRDRTFCELACGARVFSFDQPTLWHAGDGGAGAHAQLWRK